MTQERKVQAASAVIMAISEDLGALLDRHADALAGLGLTEDEAPHVYHQVARLLRTVADGIEAQTPVRPNRAERRRLQRRNG
ncbi:hypothetical protein BH10ACT1_BH10ACT1_33380 [soil metagenome]